MSVGQDTNDFIQKLKHSQAFTALNKSKDVFKLLSNQLQRQNEMQLEVIRQFNEHEKNMNAQLVSGLSDLYITTPHFLFYFSLVLICVQLHHLTEQL